MIYGPSTGQNLKLNNKLIGISCSFWSAGVFAQASGYVDFATRISTITPETALLTMLILVGGVLARFGLDLGNDRFSLKPKYIFPTIVTSFGAGLLALVVTDYIVREGLYYINPVLEILIMIIASVNHAWVFDKAKRFAEWAVRKFIPGNDK